MYLSVFLSDSDKLKLFFTVSLKINVLRLRGFLFVEKYKNPLDGRSIDFAVFSYGYIFLLSAAFSTNSKNKKVVIFI